MERIINAKLSSLPNDLHKIGDLFYLYYSLQSLYRTNKGELYICTWVERDDEYNRWLLFKVSSESVLQYLDNKISDLDLIKSSPADFICFDVDKDQNNHNIIECPMSSLPYSYLPKPSAVFDEEDAPDIEAIRPYLIGNKLNKSTHLEISYIAH